MTTSVLSSEHHRIVLQSFRDDVVSDEFLASFQRKVERFAHDINLSFEPHNRGNFAYFNFGSQHASGNNNKVSRRQMARGHRLVNQSPRNLTVLLCTSFTRSRPASFSARAKCKSSCESSGCAVCNNWLTSNKVATLLLWLQSGFLRSPPARESATSIGGRIQKGKQPWSLGSGG